MTLLERVLSCLCVSSGAVKIQILPCRRHFIANVVSKAAAACRVRMVGVDPVSCRGWALISEACCSLVVVAFAVGERHGCFRGFVQAVAAWLRYVLICAASSCTARQRMQLL